MNMIQANTTRIAALVAAMTVAGAAHAAHTFGTTSDGAGTQIGTALTGSVTVAPPGPVWQRSAAATTNVVLDDIAAASLTTSGTTSTGNITIPSSGASGTSSHAAFYVRTSNAVRGDAFSAANTGITVDVLNPAGTVVSPTATLASSGVPGTAFIFTLPIMNGTNQIGTARVPLHTVALNQSGAANSAVQNVRPCFAATGSVMRGGLLPSAAGDISTTGTEGRAHIVAHGGRNEPTARSQVSTIIASNTATGTTAAAASSCLKPTSATEAHSYDLMVGVRATDMQVTFNTASISSTTSYSIPVTFRVQLT